MPINISAFSNATTAALSLSNLILATPQAVKGYQPQNPPNADGSPSREQKPPTLMFQYEGEQTFSLESDITDHYLEDNRAVADHIALKPEIVQTAGFIGELNDVPPLALELLKSTANRLTAVGSYVPDLSAGALILYNQAFAAYQLGKNIVNNAVAAWSSLSSIGGVGSQSVIGDNGLVIGSAQNKQQEMFQQFYGYWSNKTLFTVQTPWAVIENMAILSIRAIQDAETRMISTFEVRFKRIRVAQTIIEGPNFGFNALDGRAGAQGAALTDFGAQSPVPSTSLSDGLSSMFA